MIESPDNSYPNWYPRSSDPLTIRDQCRLAFQLMGPLRFLLRRFVAVDFLWPAAALRESYDQSRSTS